MTICWSSYWIQCIWMGFSFVRCLHLLFATCDVLVYMESLENHYLLWIIVHGSGTVPFGCLSNAMWYIYIGNSAIAHTHTSMCWEFSWPVWQKIRYQLNESHVQIYYSFRALCAYLFQCRHPFIHRQYRYIEYETYSVIQHIIIYGTNWLSSFSHFRSAHSMQPSTHSSIDKLMRVSHIDVDCVVSCRPMAGKKSFISSLSHINDLHTNTYEDMPCGPSAPHAEPGVARHSGWGKESRCEWIFCKSHHYIHFNWLFTYATLL